MCSDTLCSLYDVDALSNVSQLLLLVKLELQYFLVLVFQDDNVSVVIANEKRSEAGLIEIAEPLVECGARPPNLISILIKLALMYVIMLLLFVRMLHIFVNANSTAVHRCVMHD